MSWKLIPHAIGLATFESEGTSQCSLLRWQNYQLFGVMEEKNLAKLVSNSGLYHIHKSVESKFFPKVVFNCVVLCKLHFSLCRTAFQK